MRVLSVNPRLIDRREWQSLAAAPHHRKIYSVEAILQATLHQDIKRGSRTRRRGLAGPRGPFWRTWRDPWCVPVAGRAGVSTASKTGASGKVLPPHPTTARSTRSKPFCRLRSTRIFGELGEILGVYLSRVERVLAPGKRKKSEKRPLKVLEDPQALVVSCEQDRREWQSLAAAPHHRKIYSLVCTCRGSSGC
jgi:hypothetical protein